MWELRYRGKSKTFRGSKSAAGRELALMVALESGRPPKGFTLADTIQAWLDHMAPQHSAKTAAEGRRLLATRIETDQVGKVAVDRLSARDLDGFYGRLVSDGMTPGNLRPIHKVITAALAQAFKWGWVSENVAKRSSPPAYSPPEKVIPETDELTKALVALLATSPEVGSMVFVGALTGLRRGELCGLQWDCVDLEAKTLKVERAVAVVNGKCVLKGPKTKKGVRTLDLDDVSVSLLAAQWQRTQLKAEEMGLALTADSPAFVWSSLPDSSQPYHPDSITQHWRRHAQKHGVPHTVHALRHWNATTMLAAGVPLAEVQKRLGHSSPAVTLSVYTHALPDGGKAAAKTVQRALMPGSDATG